MRIVFCISGFTRSALSLQPWLTVYEVARKCLSKGHTVNIITENNIASENDGVSIWSVANLRGYNSEEVIDCLNKIEPQIAVVSVTPLSLITSKWYEKLGDYHSLAYISYPFYTLTETWRAFPYLTGADKIAYGRHVLIPKAWWRSRLRKIFHGVICQSARTGQRLAAVAGPDVPIHVIPPGIDTDGWADALPVPRDTEKTRFLFVGAPSRIRGFSLVLDALKKIEDGKIHLKVLARGLDADAVTSLERQINAHKLQDYVSVKGGWLDRTAMKHEITASSAVVMPFALVPSELPVSVFEAIYCGTPVIVSNIDGLPDAAGEAGIVVDQCSVESLAGAMDRVHRDQGLIDKLRKACVVRKSTIRSWDEATHDWMKAMGA